jgi:hypothetical protein
MKDTPHFHTTKSDEPSPLHDLIERQIMDSYLEIDALICTHQHTPLESPAWKVWHHKQKNTPSPGWWLRVCNWLYARVSGRRATRLLRCIGVQPSGK